MNMHDDPNTASLGAFDAEGDANRQDVSGDTGATSVEWIVLSGDDARRALEAFAEEPSAHEGEEILHFVTEAQAARRPERPAVIDDHVSPIVIHPTPRAQWVLAVAAARHRVSGLTRAERYILAAFLPAAALAAWIGGSPGAARRENGFTRVGAPRAAPASVSDPAEHVGVVPSTAGVSTPPAQEAVVTASPASLHRENVAAPTAVSASPADAQRAALTPSVSASPRNERRR
jgi:hypothetical protein